MEDIRLQKLKTTLYDVINNWVNEKCQDPEWDSLDTSIGDFAVELMTDSAFNILLAQSDISNYLRNDGQIQ